MNSRGIRTKINTALCVQLKGKAKGIHPLHPLQKKTVLTPTTIFNQKITYDMLTVRARTIKHVLFSPFSILHFHLTIDFSKEKKLQFINKR